MGGRNSARLVIPSLPPQARSGPRPLRAFSLPPDPLSLYTFEKIHRSSLSLSSRASPASRSGFSLVEMLVVIAVIGIVSAIAIPKISSLSETTQIAATASDLKNFAQAIRTYRIQEGSYPLDSHNVLPNGLNIEQYLSEGSFVKKVPISGQYNWEGPDNHDYAGISLFGTTASLEVLTRLDAMLDDGNLSQGIFRLTNKGRYTYIIDE
ncbi:MAG: prepilin-type N-terminal cleavage/methylation domain-containing protein [Verrucomicrobiota bacterium]